ncbi:MAG TPA: hypothetical protein VK592_03920 [Candidatus Dormibacteraeota bacterium]|nr:hypothetical protein [Candidatus Dormibacteraeota bacterium]
MAAVGVVGILAAALSLTGCGSSPTSSPTLPLGASPSLPLGSSPTLPLGAFPTLATANPQPTSTPFGTSQPRLASAANGEQLVDPQLGWVGSSETFFGTSDGGSTWQELYWGDLHWPWFVDARHGWATGRPDLMRTVDGGNSWQPVALPDGYFADDLRFSDASHGYVLAHSATRTEDVLWTDDAGAHWTIQRANWPTLKGTFLSSQPTFFDRANGFLELTGPEIFNPLNGGPTLYSTGDGAKSWQAVDLPRPPSATPDARAAALYLAMRPVVFDARTAMVERAWLTPDGTDEVTAFYLTTDAGQHWTLANSTAGVGPVAVLSSARWILGTDSGLHATTDGGQTWYELGASGLPRPWRWFDFVDDLHGWAGTGGTPCGTQSTACGSRTLYATTDGGRSWTPLQP